VAVPDRITLRGLTGHGFHGWYEEERVQGQQFVVDVALDVDTRPAAEADELSLTADYAALARRVVDHVEGDPVRLIETLAARIAATCLQPPVRAVEVTVHKPQASLGVPVGDVAVTIRRTRP
jgi:dihydroneopterin aldolase